MTCRNLTFWSVLQGGTVDPEVLARQKQEPGDSKHDNNKP